ncbi:NADH-quinone oxidoreductase subunit C [Ornithinicoccus halotolerans]|uniref:NADH-quinone oxidoreductase subunit C n=1 Tax=Ornithinicoccus halotolerans TaxID=1748220 RepID=UPI001E5EE00D|nr:NADH-quinone oxidoreductase subunit C [Ornithinicoccus halotolerans]
MSVPPGLVTRDVPRQEWRAAAEQARAEGYDFFDWLSAVDQSDAEEDPGLDVVCHLMATGPDAPRPLARLLLRTRVPDGQPLASLTGLFAGAAWAERETHEMFGLPVDGFDDGTGAGLRPLLLPDGFEGTPLRKEFVLAARASKAWPGAKEPGEGEGSRPRRSSSRRRLLPPGVPDPSWGPR